MRSFIAWVGGKSLLAEAIVKKFPQHRCYVEVFGGAGWVLFKKEQAKVEVYNDLNGDLVNLFRIVKRRPAELKERMSLALYSRETYYEFLNAEYKHLDEVDLAARFYCLIKTAFGSNPDGHGFGYSKTQPARTLWNDELISKVQARLKRVYIENNPFQKILKAYDSPETLFYCDPPYYLPGQKFYQHDFKEDDHVALREALGKVKGKWILSYNDSPQIRKLYRGFKLRKTATIRYTMNNKREAPRQKSEILISNF